MYGHERSLVEGFSGRPFVLLGVNTDKEKSRVKKAVADNNLNWRSWMDGSTSGPICKDFKVSAFPTIMLIDHNGVIRYHSKSHRIRAPKVLDAVLEQMVSAAEADGMEGGSEPGPKFREFVDVTGKHKIQAAYAGYSEGKVILLKENDEKAKVPWNKLSIADRQFVAIARLKESGIKNAAKGGGGFDFGEPFDFSDKSGNSVSGTFMGLEKGKVIVWKEDGSQVEIPYRKISDETKEFIREEIKRFKNLN